MGRLGCREGLQERFGVVFDPSQSSALPAHDECDDVPVDDAGPCLERYILRHLGSGANRLVHPRRIGHESAWRRLARLLTPLD